MDETRDGDGIEGEIAAARARLRAALAAIDAELRAYPTPVAGCDAQYNHLLARRRQVRAALNALEAGD